MALRSEHDAIFRRTVTGKGTFGRCGDRGSDADNLDMSRSSARPHAGIRPFAVSLLVLLCLGIVTPPAGASTGDITEFTIPTLRAVAGDRGRPRWCVVVRSAERQRDRVALERHVQPIRAPERRVGSLLGRAGPRRERVVHGALGEPDREDHIDRRDHRVPDPDRRQSARRDHGRARRCAVVHRTTGNRIGRITTAGRSRSSSCRERVRAARDHGGAGRCVVVHRGGHRGEPDRADHDGWKVTEYPFVFANRQPTDITSGPTATCGSRNAQATP